MAPVSHLSALDDRLAILARRVWRMRIAGGVCRLVLAALPSGLGIVLLDAALDLSVASRCLLEVAWLAILSVATWRFILKPWNDEVSTLEIARRLEAHFPELGERLLSIIELRDEPDIAPELLDSLARDTQARTRDLKFQKALSIRPLVGVATGAALALAATIALASSISGAGEQLRRVALPWYRPAVALHFEIIVTSGDAVVRRGDSVTLTAYLRARDSSIACPDTATLIFRNAADDAETSVPMVGVQPGAFHRTLSFVERDFEYRIQAGPATSEWFAVRVADPVELTDRTSVAIVPPSYAANVPAKAILGFTDIDAIQFSTASFRFHFNRPAESVVLEWRPEGRSTLEASDPIPLELGADRMRATATFALRANGVLRAVLVNETGPRRLRTEMSANVRVVVDSPPSFERISGLAGKLRTVKPGEQLVFEFEAADDRGIEFAELESSSGTKQPIALSAANATRTSGRVAFAIPPDARDGETFGFRVRVRDTRRVNDPKLNPQESVYPAEGWSTLLVSGSAPPLDQQEIFGLRDALREGLQATLREFQEASGEVESLRADTAGHSPLPIDHGLRLAAIRDRLRKVNLPLEAVSRDLALTSDARGLAAAIREVSANALRDADEAFQRATTDSAEDRATALGTARKHLLAASTRFEELLKENERLARDRLDRRRLEALASDQSMLADRAEAGTGNELLKLQRELLERLMRLVEESDPLKRGIETATASESAKLASETQALVAKLRELDTAAQKLEAEVRKSILDALADAVMNRTERDEKLQPRFETAMRLAGLALPKREDVQRVAELIRQNKIVEALTELERLAQGLDRVATEFEKWTVERNDPKLAAQQLAKWQDDLRSRLLAASKPEKLPEVQLPNFRAEQSAIAGSFERLRLPPGSKIAALREAAIVHLRMASRRLDGDGAGADMAMRFASESLAKLGEQLPSAADRLARGSVEFEKVRVEQEAIVAGVQQVLRSFDKQIPNAPVIQSLIVKFLPWQLRQQKLAERLASLDFPGHESRRARAVLAAKAASADLTDGLPYDAISSLAWSRRELDRLRQALQGLAPADDVADELAKKQAEVARLLSTAGERPTVTQLESVVALQLEVYRRRDSLSAPEAAALHGDAVDAVRLAELSLKNGSSHEQILRRSRDAAEAFAILADRLNERETDRDRVLRLASNRKQAECVAKVLAGKPLLPEASEKARNELKSEIEELLLTRVGESGQVPKKALLEAYARLQNKTEPDRQAADQKQLAGALNELAATMAEVNELATKPKEVAPAPLDPTEGYLPSKALADRLRERARGHRDIRQRANAIAVEIVERLKPESKGEPAIAAAQQKLRHEALSKEASELARLFDRSAEDASPSEPEAKSHAAASQRIRRAERLLADAAQKVNEGESVEAARLRSEAERALQQAAARAPRAAQPLDARAMASGEAARTAERAMRRAIRELERKGSDISVVEQAMRRAATALKLAANPPSK